MRAALARLPGRSDVAAAIRYALARGDGLTRYLDDGHLAIDNNPAERARSPSGFGMAHGLS